MEVERPSEGKQTATSCKGQAEILGDVRKRVLLLAQNLPQRVSLAVDRLRVAYARVHSLHVSAGDLSVGCAAG